MFLLGKLKPSTKNSKLSIHSLKVFKSFYLIPVAHSNRGFKYYSSKK